MTVGFRPLQPPNVHPKVVGPVVLVGLEVLQALVAGAQVFLHSNAPHHQYGKAKLRPPLPITTW